MGMTWEEHLAWSKERALKFLPDDPVQAFASMASDLDKHEEGRNHIGIKMGMELVGSGALSDMRDFIEGFN